MPVHQIVNGGPADPEQFSRLDDISVHSGERLHECVALCLVPYLTKVDRVGKSSSRLQTEIFRSDQRPIGHDDCTLDAVLHLPDIARPRMAFDRGNCLLAEIQGGAFLLGAKFVFKVMRQQGGIPISALAKGGS